MFGRAWELLKWFFEKPQSAPERPWQPRAPRKAPQARDVVSEPEPESFEKDADSLDFLKLKALVVQRRFDGARALLRDISEDAQPEEDSTDNAGKLCESVADDLRDWDRDGSIWLYEQALFYFQEYASWATTGGEGSVRMSSVSRVDSKLRQLRAADTL